MDEIKLRNAFNAIRKEQFPWTYEVSKYLPLMLSLIYKRPLITSLHIGLSIQRCTRRETMLERSIWVQML